MAKLMILTLDIRKYLRYKLDIILKGCEKKSRQLDMLQRVCIGENRHRRNW